MNDKMADWPLCVVVLITTNKCTKRVSKLMNEWVRQLTHSFHTYRHENNVGLHKLNRRMSSIQSVASKIGRFLMVLENFYLARKLFKNFRDECVIFFFAFVCMSFSFNIIQRNFGIIVRFFFSLHENIFYWK